MWVVKRRKKMSVVVRATEAPVHDRLEASADDYNPPVVYDAHCWVERDGAIVDPWFPQYDLICMIRGVKQTMAHKPAPPLVQTIILGSLGPWMKRIVHQVMVEGFIFEPRANNCFLNAAIEQAKRGGTLVVGSLGFGTGKSVWWEYGGDTYTTVKDFKVNV